MPAAASLVVENVTAPHARPSGVHLFQPPALQGLLRQRAPSSLELRWCQNDRTSLSQSRDAEVVNVMTHDKMSPDSKLLNCPTCHTLYVAD